MQDDKSSEINWMNHQIVNNFCYFCINRKIMNLNVKFE